MPRLLRAIRPVLLAALAGCGGAPSTSNPGLSPPHGGNLIQLPDGKGFVEVVSKPGAAGKGPLTSEASFYFLKDSGTPFAPAPASGTLTVNKKTVTLKSEGEALVTPTGPALFPKGDVDGVLTVELDGRAQSIPLGLR